MEDVFQICGLTIPYHDCSHSWKRFGCTPSVMKQWLAYVGAYTVVILNIDGQWYAQVFFTALVQQHLAFDFTDRERLDRAWDFCKSPEDVVKTVEGTLASIFDREHRAAANLATVERWFTERALASQADQLEARPGSTP